MIRNYVMGCAIALLAPTVVVQPATAQGTAITNVQIQRTDSGIELILASPTGKQPETFQTTYGETLVIDLINTQLQGEGFLEENPVAGIASVEVIQQYSNTVRVKLVGTEDVPNAEVTSIGEGIAVNVTTDKVTTAEEPTPEAPTTEPDVTPEAPEAQAPIELVVTATRTEERQEDVARSVTVIDREEIEQQATLTENLGDILGKLVPGFGPPTFSNRTNRQTLRGRQPQILVDGVPLRSNSALDIQISFIAPSSIERIEVVRGPTAIYGGEAKGGVINIITRKPTEKSFEATTEVGLGAALGGLEGDSFRNRQQQTLSFNQDAFDFTFTFSRNDKNSLFDAEGDHIGPNNASLANTTTLNLNSKLGVDLTEEQRLQLTFNYTRDRHLINSVTETTPEKAIGIERDFDFEDDTEPTISNTIANLSYTHEDLLGSEIQAQLYYRDSFQRSIVTDLRETFPPLGVFNNESGSTVWGGRLQADTSLGQDANLLLGLDYEQQDVERTFFNLLSGSAFDQGVIRDTGEDKPNAPPIDFNKLGIFAQLQWEATEWLSLSGGIRNEQFDLQVDDYITFSGDSIEGGELDFSDTTFNVGAVTDLSESVNVFAKFSQGFSAPPFNDVLRSVSAEFSVDDGLEDLQPQKVDEYEIGIRGNWESVNATLSTFYNFSDFGANLVLPDNPNEFAQLQRAPTRIYGIEATVDWQATDDWTLGGIVSWNQGESDPDDDGEFDPLSSSEIQPLKLTAYVENQTTPGWRNRLQLLIVSNRDKAFEEGIDPGPVESYAVLDYISSIQIGDGALNIGIENLLDSQYFPVNRQLGGANNPNNQLAASGRRITINYSLTW